MTCPVRRASRRLPVWRGPGALETRRGAPAENQRRGKRRNLFQNEGHPARPDFGRDHLDADPGQIGPADEVAEGQDSQV